MLCQGVSGDSAVQTTAGVDEVCHQCLLSPQGREQDDNLIFVRERLGRSQAGLPELLPLYRRIRSGQPAASEAGSPEVTALRLCGSVRQERGGLRVRNRSYERVFDLAWVDRTQTAAK